MAADLMQIGELSLRVGVSTHTLRAWERRYGLLQPQRTPSGYRLYDSADERRTRRVVAARARGVPVSVAVRRVLDHERRAAGDGPQVLGGSSTSAMTAGRYLEALHHAARAYDERAIHTVLDQIFDAMALDDVIDTVVMPFLQGLGDRWADGEVSVGREHFATGVIRRRLEALCLDWGTVSGPPAVLACPSGERHDLALLCFGLLLSRVGWRIHYLGTDTPCQDVLEARRALRADAVVLSATTETAMRDFAAEWRHDPGCLVAIGGRGASARVAAELGAVVLPTVLSTSVTALTTPRPAPVTS